MRGSAKIGGASLVRNSKFEIESASTLSPSPAGSEREFNARFGKAVQAARYSKKGSKELEAGLLAVEALHKQARARWHARSHRRPF